ncbi:uncharacterized protein BDR25DRAFT_350042 [Lindgomyces ingoldianus]|uniref:Uncharacterized protein n=1 Tax=Lindgomyces ingoldianus TaxID=673940 RepID=A0ACB6R916_9PLEO|nr:uncharacterized protein BDR25DRAFT_350042 [Lindgomyces ingoldianus]KAF2475749.1 hypothetical protein BDR25DRAFT_350042 [Lindgomyces ingoldianus]
MFVLFSLDSFRPGEFTLNGIDLNKVHTVLEDTPKTSTSTLNSQGYVPPLQKYPFSNIQLAKSSSEAGNLNESRAIRQVHSMARMDIHLHVSTSMYQFSHEMVKRQWGFPPRKDRATDGLITTLNSPDQKSAMMDSANRSFDVITIAKALGSKMPFDPCSQCQLSAATNFWGEPTVFCKSRTFAQQITRQSYKALIDVEDLMGYFFEGVIGSNSQGLTKRQQFSESVLIQRCGTLRFLIQAIYWRLIEPYRKAQQCPEGLILIRSVSSSLLDNKIPYPNDSYIFAKMTVATGSEQGRERERESSALGRGLLQVGDTETGQYRVI